MTATPSSRPIAAYGAFFGCTAIWGSTFLFIALGNDTVPPIWAATLRLGLASAILRAMSLASRSGLPRGPALVAAAWLGFFQFGLTFPLLYWGETVVPSGIASILFATVPLTSALMARGFGLERLSLVKIGGALIALAGVTLIFSGELSSRVSVAPMVAILAATQCACLGTMLYKKGPRQSAIGANAVATAVGFAVSLALSVVTRESMRIPATWAALGPILYLTVAGSVGAFVLFTWLVGQWSVSRATYVAFVSPLVALSLGVMVRHEQLTPIRVVGSAVVLGGVGIGLLPWRRPG